MFILHIGLKTMQKLGTCQGHQSVKYAANYPEIKHLRLLFDKAKIRKKEKLFVIEGEREIGRALAGGYTVQKYFFHEALPPEKRDYYSELDPSSFSYILEAHLFDKIGYRSGTEKMIAVAEAKSLDWNVRPFCHSIFYLILITLRYRERSFKRQ